MMNTVTTPIQIEPSGPREVVDREKALEFVQIWTRQLLEHRALVADGSASATSADNDSNGDRPPRILCDRIRLSDKSYTAEAAEIVASFLQSSIFDDYPPLTYGICKADLSDIIAGRMTEEALIVLKTICDAFADSSNLVDVDLSDNAIGEQAIEACETVLTKRSLERLSLGNNGLAGNTMAKVADILTRDDEGLGCIASNLTKLHFFHNMSGEKGCYEFARIFEKCVRIQDLKFSSTRAGKAGSDVIASVLDSSLSEGRNPNLVRLDLCDNMFSSTASHESLFRALGGTTSLIHLNLGNCELEDDGVQKVCHALFECDSVLELLDLSGNSITKHGAKHIADYITTCGGNLKVLHLEDNDLTSKGVVSIASAFRGSEDGHSIEELQLNTCMIGTIGARALIDAFGPDGKDLPNLKKIFLNGNTFTEQVLSELEAAFDHRLGEMEDNDTDDDADEDLSDDEEECDEDNDEDGNDGYQTADTVDDLAAAMEQSLVV